MKNDKDYREQMELNHLLTHAKSQEKQNAEKKGIFQILQERKEKNVDNKQ